MLRTATASGIYFFHIYDADNNSIFCMSAFMQCVAGDSKKIINEIICFTHD